MFLIENIFFSHGVPHLLPSHNWDRSTTHATMNRLEVGIENVWMDSDISLNVLNVLCNANNDV